MLILLPKVHNLGSKMCLDTLEQEDSDEESYDIGQSDCETTPLSSQVHHAIGLLTDCQQNGTGLSENISYCQCGLTTACRKTDCQNFECISFLASGCQRGNFGYSVVTVNNINLFRRQYFQCKTEIIIVVLLPLFICTLIFAAILSTS